MSDALAELRGAILARAKSYVGKYTDADARKLALEVGAAWPHMAGYAKLAQPGTAWCGIFIAKVLSEFGIEPPFGADDLKRFMWVDAWLSYGTKVIRGEPGDIAIWLTGPHHVSFVAGDGLYCGGNQGDKVSIAPFRAPDAFRRIGPPRRDTMPALPPAPSLDLSSGRGSWYSQYRGRHSWVDQGDEPGSNALGVPDDRQGIALKSRATLGEWFEVTAPNGKTLLLQHTDIGPGDITLRDIDISARAAEAFGYSPGDFPTDKIFSWRPSPPPFGLADLNPREQARRYVTPISPTPISEPATLSAAAIHKAIGAIESRVALIELELKTLRSIKVTDPTTPAPRPKIDIDIDSIIDRAARAAVGMQRAQQTPIWGAIKAMLPTGGLYGSLIGIAVLWAMQAFDMVGTGAAPAAGGTPTGGLLTSLLTGTGGISVVALVKQLVGGFLRRRA
jgi:hypothetical protein